MLCGLGAADCAVRHIAPELSLRCTQASRQWTGACPVCGGGHCFSLTVKAGKLLWRCHREPPCSQEIIQFTLSGIFPACIPVPRRRRPRSATVARSDLEQLLGLHGAAQQLALACLAWDCTPETAAAKLGMPRRTYYRAVSAVPNLAQSRRSA